MRLTSLKSALITGLALSCFAVMAPACDKKKEGETADKKAGEAGDKKAEEAGDKKPAKPAGPKAQEAGEFFTAIGKMKGMEAMNAYKDGVLINGKVKRTLTEMDKSVKVMLVAGEKTWVTLSFTDKGAAVTKAGVKEGAELKAQCKLGGGTDNYYMLTDCELK